MAAVAFRVTGAGKVFHRGSSRIAAFHGVDLEVPAGEIVVLLGPSGCGKSTLLRSIAGLERLDTGRVEVGQGVDSVHAFGIAFQQPSLLPWLTVAGNVALGLRFDAIRQAAAAHGGDPGEMVTRTIVDLGLRDVADAFPDELSGGQAQRANVARVIVTGRPILLLDEPFAALDPATRAGLQDWLVALQRSRSLTVLIVTHDVSEALRLGDRIALMTGAPGSIARVWDVRSLASGDLIPADALRREILDHYDTDRSPAQSAAVARPAAPGAHRTEGALL